MEQKVRWRNYEVVVIASGPSHLESDTADIRRWREAEDKRAVIVTNTMFRAAPWADALMAMDAAWWRVYGTEVIEAFRGDRFCWVPRYRKTIAQSLFGESWFAHFGNSGADAISLAICSCAKRVILTGFDCQHTNGKTHSHGDHPAGLKNAASVGKWDAQFERVARLARMRQVKVINCSRETRLSCFPRSMLGEVL